MLDSNCVFCKIVNGNISARIIRRNDEAIAFLDAFPLSAGHTLIIPKSHYSKVQDMKKKDSDALFDLLRRITLVVEQGVGVKASTIAIHNGTDSGQEIPHVHVHIIPRTVADGAAPIHSLFKNRPQISPKDLDLILEQIKARDLKFIDKPSSS